MKTAPRAFYKLGGGQKVGEERRSTSFKRAVSLEKEKERGRKVRVKEKIRQYDEI